MMAILINETNVRLCVPETPGKPFRRDELVLLLGGPVEVIVLMHLKNGRAMCMAINAEARIQKMSLMNPFATEIFRMFQDSPQYIVGKALLCKVPEELE